MRDLLSPNFSTKAAFFPADFFVSTVLCIDRSILTAKILQKGVGLVILKDQIFMHILLPT
jgi:hypothetical protein